MLGQKFRAKLLDKNLSLIVLSQVTCDPHTCLAVNSRAEQYTDSVLHRKCWSTLENFDFPSLFETHRLCQTDVKRSDVNTLAL